MRKLSIIAVLTATTLIVGNVSIRAQIYWEQPDIIANQLSASTMTHVGILPYKGAPTSLHFTGISNNGLFQNVYAVGGTARNTGYSLTINRLWATPEYLDSLASYQGSYVKVNELTLQVGQQTVSGMRVDSVIPQFIERTYGTENQIATEALILNSNSITYGKTTVSNIGTWGTAGKYSVENWGTIYDATVNGGTLNNIVNGSVVNLFQTGGTVNNYGEIDSLIYSGGDFNGTSGSIRTFTVAGTVSGGNWGTIDDLNFAVDGTGIIVIAGFVEGDGLGFDGIKTANVDLTGGNILLDLTDAGTLGNDWVASFFDVFDDGFTFSSLFGAETVAGIEHLYSFQVAWGEDNLFPILANGVFTDGWRFTDTGFAFNGNDAVPEPATVAIFGLGLAGLVVLRWRSASGRKGRPQPEKAGAQRRLTSTTSSTTYFSPLDKILIFKSASENYNKHENC
jgi:hypothetical protein